MIPEQNIDFSMLNLDNSAYNFQPQVFMVDTIEMPAEIDASVLSGKADAVEEVLETCNEKIEMPVIETPASTETITAVDTAPLDEEFESDPDFALFHSQPAAPTQSTETDDEINNTEIFGYLAPEKVMARLELVDATEEEATAAVALARVQRISSHIESVVSRLELLTMDL
jgi:hypothetical protein